MALTAEGTLEVTDVAEPEATGDFVVVAVERFGICGSDLHLQDMGVLPEGTSPELGVQLVRPGGKVVLLGVAGVDDPIALIDALLVVKEVDLVSCLGYTLDEFGEAVGALASGTLDTASVVSAVVPLGEVGASLTCAVRHATKNARDEVSSGGLGSRRRCPRRASPGR